MKINEISLKNYENILENLIRFSSPIIGLFGLILRVTRSDYGQILSD